MESNKEKQLIEKTIEILENQKAKYDNLMQTGNRVMDILDNAITELECTLTDELS